MRIDLPSAVASLPRVLICAADVGCGHGRAAAAVALAMRRSWPGVQLKLIDALQTTPRWFNYLYRDAYLIAARHLPRANGWLYEKTDIEGTPSDRSWSASLESIALRRFCASPVVREADLIICTHFLCARVLSAAHGKGLIRARLVVIVTDQHPHAIWRVPHADLFMVASEKAALEMARQGIDPARTLVSGIPIDRRFDHPIDRIAARRRHNLPVDSRILLLSGGGLGLGGLDRALEGIVAADRNVFTIVVCGRNQALYQQLCTRAARLRNLRVLGHTKRMHELMAAADLLVGKPGGLTTSEACAIGLPMMLLRPVPGQEDHNARILTEAGAALLEPDPFRAGELAAALVHDANTLDRMSQCAKSFGRIGSAQIAAEAAMRVYDPELSPKSYRRNLRPALA